MKMIKLCGILPKSYGVQMKRFLCCKIYENFHISEEVASGLSNGYPIIALESTIMTHGMPYPENLRTAIKVEDIIRKNKAIPATIGVINGRVTIGMNKDQLEFLSSKDKQHFKISRRDLPYILSKGLSGGTTVAATMALSYRAGIPIFVTGGIGGVHRGAEKSMDISADLFELARTPISVVSAGVKSILDIGRTLEYLETYGVCVSTYGTTDVFPAFFVPQSKFRSSCSVKNATEAAQLIDSRDALGLEGGLLLAVPILEAQSANGEEIEETIQIALAEAKNKGVSGKEVTPFVLARVEKLSRGASLQANIALIENNAHVGSLIAVELANLQQRRSMSTNVPGVRRKDFPRFVSKTAPQNDARRPVVIGGSILDLHITALDDVKMNGSTLAGKIQSSAGGVARNMADCLARLGCNPLLLSAVGAQEYRKTLLGKMTHMDTSGIAVLEDARSATCAVILDRNRECIFLVGDTEILDRISVQLVQEHEGAIAGAPIVVLDTNIPLETMEYVFDICSHHKIPVWLEPTDFSKADRPFQSEKWRGVITYASPNLNELRVMHRARTVPPGAHQDITADATRSMYGKSKVSIEECLHLCKPLMEDIRTLVVTLGVNGTLFVTTQLKDQPLLPDAKDNQVFQMGALQATHYSPPLPENIVSVSGAGDCFAAAMVGAMIAGHDQDLCVLAGQQAAMLSLASHHTVPDSISRHSVLETLERSTILSRRKPVPITKMST